jgi:hypothetical protein
MATEKTHLPLDKLFAIASLIKVRVLIYHIPSENGVLYDVIVAGSGTYKDTYEDMCRYIQRRLLEHIAKHRPRGSDDERHALFAEIFPLPAPGLVADPTNAEPYTVTSAFFSPPGVGPIPDPTKGE